MIKLGREKAKSTLLDHHSSQEYYPQNEYPNVVNTNGQYLRAYIPYIGKSYFDSKPRVLIYTMAQNLARAPRLVKAWLERPDRGLLRQYYDQATPRVRGEENSGLVSGAKETVPVGEVMVANSD